MNRRQFLQLTGLLSTSAVVAVGTHGWVVRTRNTSNLETANKTNLVTANSNNLVATAPGNHKRLVVIFLRGAVDGLNVVIPHWENAYYDMRSLIAIPTPGSAEGALNLDGRFGLHPALASLIPLWQQRKLAFVHACGSPDASRSHFDAQDYMESGTPGNKKTADGWMNRLLRVLPTHTPTQAVSLGETIPRILSGQMAVANLPTGRDAQTPLPQERRPQLENAFDQLYSGSDSLSKAYQQGRAAREQLLANLEKEMISADNGAPPAVGFSQDTQQLAQLMVRDRDIQLAFLGLGGWDTHINQGGSTGQMARKLKSLGEGIATLVQGLGPIFSETVIMVISEFGRTVAENGNGGTDHGHGNVMWLLGGGIQGGQVYGEWPGLAQSALFEGRDLAVTTDFRDVISTVLARHLQLNAEQISTVFPGFSPQNKVQLV